MTAEEIYILNTALDGEDIFGMPSVSDTHLSNILRDTYKDKLINKGILDSRSEFSDLGVRTTLILNDYKSSDYYYSFHGINIGTMPNGTATMLSQEFLYEDYRLERVKSGRIAFDFIDSFKLSTNIDILSSSTFDCTPANLYKKYRFDSSQAISIYSAKTHSNTFYIFQHEGNTLIYDIKKQQLILPSYDALLSFHP